MQTSLIAEPSVVVFLLMSSITLGAIVTLALLLSHPKTRKAAMWIMLAVIVLTVPLWVILGYIAARDSGVPQPKPIARVPSRPVTNGSDNTSLIQFQEETTLAAKPGPSLAEKPAVNKGGDKSTQPALTLTLSQGERGPSERPAWIDAKPQLIGDAYQMSISIGPYATRAECDARLSDELQTALGRYVEACLGDQAARDIRLPTDYLRQQLVKAEWQEVRPYSVGPMTQLYVLLQFDRKVKDRVLEANREAVVAGRLQAVAGCTAIGLLLLTVCFAYLKIDLATGGVYRGRLRFATGVAILGLVAAAVAVV